MKKLSGKKEAFKLNQKNKKYLTKLNLSKKPALVVILIGNDKSSELYVSLKKKAAENLGINFFLKRFSENSKQDEIEKYLKMLEKDDKISGIIVQLPIPKKFNTSKILNLIAAKKDADGLNECLERRHLFSRLNIFSPLISAILHLLNLSADLKFKKAAVFAKSKIFADNLRYYLNEYKIETIFISPNSKEKLKDMDIIISAVGKQHFISGKDIKKDAILIDVGIFKKNNKIFGDFSRSAQEKSSYFTPVPGGVGPLTVAYLMKNIIILADNLDKKQKKR